LKLLNEEEIEPYRNILEKRFSEAITPAHLLAYMLHPQYDNTRLSKKQEEIARTKKPQCRILLKY